jgi:DedD protein
MFKQKSDSAATALSPADAVQQARTRARQRLIGAVVLLGIGIIGFPLVFETQPRPIPVDIPIEIPRKDNVPPLAAPPAPAALAASAMGGDTRAAAGSSEEIVTESRGDAGRELTNAPPRAASSIAAPASAALRSTSPVVTAAPSSSPKPSVPPAESAGRVAANPPASAARPAAPGVADGERARALLEGRPAAAGDGQRFVVQVGAFADADAARETRQKAEKLGLKTYTQVAQTSGGSRIRVRVGPFASRVDAEAALAKAKAAGLAAVVLTL